MKVMVAPQKVGQGLALNLATVLDRRPLVVGLTEMDLGQHSFVPTMRETLGSSYTVISDATVGVHSQEIPVAIRNGPSTSVTSSKVVQISPDVGTKGTGNDRYLATVRFRHHGRVYVVMHTHTNAVIQISPDVGTKGTGNDRYLATVRFRHHGRVYVVMHTHTNAVIQSHTTLKMLDNERKRVTADAMQTIEDKADLVLKDPRVAALWIMGDFNILPAPPDIEWEHSPQAMFRRLGMKSENTRVVYLAWSKGLHRRGDLEVIGARTARNASDHAFLVRGFRRAPTQP
jgi:hypothetical protein